MNILYLSDILNLHDERVIGLCRESGHSLTLLTFFQRAPELPAFTQGVRIIHERFRLYPDGDGASRWRLIRDAAYRRDEARACLKIKEVLRSNRFDAVFANWALTAGYVASHAAAHPLILFPWGSDLLVWPRLHRGFLERAVMALHGADLVVCNSKTAADEARRLGRLRPDRIEVLPLELDGKMFESCPRNESLRASWGFPDRFVIISTRPLKEMYDHATLLAALTQPGCEEFAVVLVGEGNLRPDLEKRARELQIQDRVRFEGVVENRRIPEFLSAADLYVTCARSDSASLGLLEAMAAGLPVAATDIPSNREWIADGQSGWLFPPGKPEALASVLRKAAADEKERQELALRGRAIVLNRADARKNFPRLMSRVEELVRSPRTRG